MDFDQAAHNEAINRGNRAKSELLITSDLFDKIKAEAARRVMTSDVGSELNNSRLIVTYQIVDTIQNALERMVGEGEGATLILQQMMDAMN